MGAVEWVVIGFVVFIAILIIVVWLIARWLHKEEK